MKTTHFFSVVFFGLVAITVFTYLLFYVTPKIGKFVVKLLNLNIVYTVEFVDLVYFTIGIITWLLGSLVYLVGKDVVNFIL